MNQSKRKSGGLAIVTLKRPGISNDLYVVNVTDQDKGSGRTMSHNRRSHTPWSTQVDLMDHYPEHHFVASSAQQYKWLEELYPPLFERTPSKALEGKFHPIGGSWVENDAKCCPARRLHGSPSMASATSNRA